MDERMDAPNGKRIVELLRRAAMGIYEGAKGKVMDNIAQLIGCYGAMDYRTIDKLADMVEEAIQHEHESAYDEGYDAGFASVDDWCAQHEDAMAEHGWVRLPKDADGEPIHIGDELRDEWYEQNQGEVEWLMLDHHGWWLMLKNNCERFYVHEFHEWRHHHAPTVEDVLWDMHMKLDEVAALHADEPTDSDERERDVARIFAEYSAKLQLRGDAE